MNRELPSKRGKTSLRCHTKRSLCGLLLRLPVLSLLPDGVCPAYTLCCLSSISDTQRKERYRQRLPLGRYTTSGSWRKDNRKKT